MKKYYNINGKNYSITKQILPKFILTKIGELENLRSFARGTFIITDIENKSSLKEEKRD